MLSDENEQVESGRRHLREVSSILHSLSDSAVRELFKEGALDDLLLAILDPRDVSRFTSIQDFLWQHKTRAEALARMRHVITNNYSFPVVVEGREKQFISPMIDQWFDDSLMYTLGGEPFSGYICSYQNGIASYAIAARDIQRGDDVSKESFEFIPAEAFNEMLEKSRTMGTVPLEQPVKEIQELMRAQVNDESRYQELLERYPWVLGGQYSGISRHTKLDDSNIPDFTASRSHDHFRDLIEIKPPFTPLFRADGQFNASFNDYWNQAERYLDFCRSNRDYLQNAKGLRFDNPRCYLILGYQLNNGQIDAIRRKQRMNPSIAVLTYDDLLTFMKSTVAFIRSLKEQAIPTESNSEGAIVTNSENISLSD